MKPCRPVHQCSTAVDRIAGPLLAALLFLYPTVVAAQDLIGIYFDDQYTQDQIDVTATPSIVDAYLVLREPSQLGGIAGWECCVEIDGNAVSLNWDLAGDTVNVLSPPCFMVGIGLEPLLPENDVILLAAFQVLVSDLDLVTLSVTPTSIPSLPGEMAYLPWDYPDEEVPMYPVTGQPAVAWINEPQGICDIQTPFMNFGSQLVGTVTTRIITVANVGAGDLELDVTLPDTATAFSIILGGGINTVPPGEEFEIAVAFSPQEVGSYSAPLLLGSSCDDVPLIGEGEPPYESCIVTPEALNFGSVIVGDAAVLTIQIHNNGNLPFEITPVVDCDAFTVFGSNLTIYPGVTITREVRFEPVEAGDWDCILNFGSSTCADVTLIGTAVDPPNSEENLLGFYFDPDFLTNEIQLPDTPVLTPGYLVLNNSTATSGIGGWELCAELTGPADWAAWDLQGNAVNVSSPPCFTVGIGGEPLPWSEQILLASCEILVQDANSPCTVVLTPTATPSLPGHMVFVPWDNLTAETPMTTITGAPTVAWINGALPVCTVDPPEQDYGNQIVGSVTNRWITIVNTGGGTLDLDVALPDTAVGFILTSGGGVHHLLAGDTHHVSVAFSPPAPGAYAAVVHLGETCSEYPLYGIGEAALVDCYVSEELLDFGSALAGDPVTRYVEVRNTGNVPFIMEATIDCEVFHVDGTPRTILPGASELVEVTMVTALVGDWQCSLDLGLPECASVDLVGTTLAPPDPDANLVGIYFDTAYTQNTVEVPDTPNVVQGYLVLSNCSFDSGIGGWELCAELTGPSLWAGWELEGTAVNVLSPPCFMVGIGGEPLPYAEDILLATCSVFVQNFMPESIISLGPTDTPSIPGHMAFVPWEDLSAETPLLTATGTPEVAWINLDLPYCTVDPAVLGLGDVAVGYWSDGTFEIANVGGGVLHVVVEFVEPTTEFEIIAGGGSHMIPGGQSRQVTVRYEPTQEGPSGCLVSIGANCAPVEIGGTGVPGLPACRLEPDLIEFPNTPTNLTTWREFTIFNEGNTFLAGDLAVTGPHFSLEEPGLFGLAPTDSLTVAVAFHPQEISELFGLVETGLPSCPLVDLHGTGVEYSPGCEVDPTELLFGPVQVGTQLVRGITVSNTGTFNLELELESDTTAFQVLTPTGPFTLEPGGSVEAAIAFVPGVPGEYNGTIVLGSEHCAPVPCTGLGVNDDSPCGFARPAINLGVVTLGQPASDSVEIRNLGSDVLDLFVSLQFGDQGFSILAGGGEQSLLPGESMFVSIQGEYSGVGVFSDYLQLGEECWSMPMYLVGPSGYLGYSVDPLNRCLGCIGVNQTASGFLTISNNQNQQISGDLQVTGAGYSSADSGPFTLYPGQSRSFDIRCNPQSVGFHAGIISTGLPGGDEAFFGARVLPGRMCSLDPPLLDFGALHFGESAQRTFTITNESNEDLDGSVSVTEGGYSVVSGGGDFILSPGQSHAVEIRFQPSGWNDHVSEVLLGMEECRSIPVSGFGFGTTDGGPRLGLYFDPEFTESIHTPDASPVVTGFLVLRDEAAVTGISSWECRVNMSGPAQWLGWELAPGADNSSEPPVFVVDYPQTPLPPGVTHLLGTFQVLLTPGNDPVEFTVHPAQWPVLTGWPTLRKTTTPWRRHGINTVTDGHLIGVITDGLVGLDTPAPTVNVTGDAVQLSWAAPGYPHDGYLIYRRDPGGQTTLLNTETLPPASDRFLYTDYPRGHEPGTTLYYSYGIITGGTETARSPETAMTLSSPPVRVTRLLSNVPNPFNPLTRIRFQLATAGPVRITVYDVTGRRIRTLFQGDLGSGLHELNWQGRDDRGRTVPSGAYYVRLDAGGILDHHKIMLLK